MRSTQECLPEVNENNDDFLLDLHEFCHTCKRRSVLRKTGCLNLRCVFSMFKRSCLWSHVVTQRLGDPISFPGDGSPAMPLNVPAVFGPFVLSRRWVSRCGRPHLLSICMEVPGGAYYLTLPESQRGDGPWAKGKKGSGQTWSAAEWAQKMQHKINRKHEKRLKEENASKESKIAEKAQEAQTSQKKRRQSKTRSKGVKRIQWWQQRMSGFVS